MLEWPTNHSSKPDPLNLRFDSLLIRALLGCEREAGDMLES